MTDHWAASRIIGICQTSRLAHGLQSNVNQVVAWMKEAAEKGAEIALFGELFLTENNPSNLCELETYLKSCGGSVAVVIQKAAKELGIAVIYGYPEVENGCHYNSLMFVNKRGEQLANYRKVHLWPSEKELYTPENAVAVVDWDGLTYTHVMGHCSAIDLKKMNYKGVNPHTQYKNSLVG